MREMRHIVTLFSKSNGFDKQWILFKAYLNTTHPLSDNDSVAKNNFYQNELMNFAWVLRNILHHQPAKWHFGFLIKLIFVQKIPINTFIT